MDGGLHVDGRYQPHAESVFARSAFARASSRFASAFFTDPI